MAAESPRTDDPIVTLLEPGAEPRAPLRYRFAPGARKTLTIEVKSRTRSHGKGAPPGTQISAPVRTTVEVRVTGVDAQGIARMLTSVTGVEVLGGPLDDVDANRRVQQRMAAMVGIVYEMGVTPRGGVRDVKVRTPEGTPAEVEAALQSMRSSQELAFATFPVEPVGIGARWLITVPADTGALRVINTVTASLVERRQDSVRLGLTFDQTAYPQPMRLPGPGSVHLDAYQGRGQGQMETSLDTGSARLEVSMDSTFEMTFVTGSGQAKTSMDCHTSLTVAPPQPEASPAHASRWVYQAREGTFRVTFPSKQWTQLPASSSSPGEFSQKQPRMYATVRAAVGRSFGDYVRRIQEMAVPFARMHVPQEKDGLNAAGNRYHYVQATVDVEGGRAAIAAYSVTWLEGKRTMVEVIFRGFPQTTSVAAWEREMQAIGEAARLIPASVE